MPLAEEASYQLSSAAIDALAESLSPVVFPARFSCGHSIVLSQAELTAYKEGQAGLAVIAMRGECRCIKIEQTVCPACTRRTQGEE